MARSREDQQRVPIDEVANRIGTDVLRVGNIGDAQGVKFETYWDGTPSMTHSDAQRVMAAIHADDEHARHLTAETVAAQERQIEAERVRLLKEQAQADKRGPLVGLEVHYPGDPEPEWSNE